MESKILSGLWTVQACPTGHIVSVAPGMWRCPVCSDSLDGAEFVVIKQPTLEGPGQARRTDSTTAKAAASVNPVKRGTQRWAVLAAVVNQRASGATSHELEDITAIRYASLTPRIGELKKAGYLIASGKTRPGKYGVEQEVLLATTAGWQVIGSGEPLPIRSSMYSTVEEDE